jgi:predicted nucleotidyltransferase/uncharacterized protein (UPF0332 family)
MDYKVDKKEKPNKEKFPKSDIDIAYDFSKEAYKEFGTFLKAVVIFGSQTKEKAEKDSDIDILLIVDDVSIVITEEITETYKIILERLVAKKSRKLHITTLRFTSFWDFIRNGDPVAINILREGMPLIDTGFFEPLQRLLMQGKIKPTKESIWTYFSRAPTTLHNSKWHVMQAATNLYWAVIDAAHAALMQVGEMPPSPDHVSDLLQVRLVNEGKLKQKYADTMKNFFELYKGIAHRKVKEVTGTEYDHYYQEAEEFIKEMQKFIK